MKKIFHGNKGSYVEVIRKRITAVLMNKKGSGYVDQAVVILIAVVLGALLLAGLYALFGDVVLPEITRRIQEMFNYAG